MEAEDLNRAYAALVGVLALLFAGILAKASANWLLWNSPVSIAGLWSWVLRYKLDDLAMLLIAGSAAYLLLLRLGER
ncbi:MAG: hypothetical protein GXO66_04010 [Euryarchaeota archaeon]|nr:hypothetical protein [Euryarchaeota archaeon]